MPVSSRFPLLGEPLVIDLVNTCVRRNGSEVDLLDTPAALTTWLRGQRDRLAWRGSAHAADLQDVRTLRDAIGCLLHALREHQRPPADALHTINRSLSLPVPRQQLVWKRGGIEQVSSSARSPRHTLLHALAVDAMDILTGPDGARVRQCAHPDCILWFIARNPRRHWCSSAVCGNRARVARHYMLQHGGLQHGGRQHGKRQHGAD